MAGAQLQFGDDERSVAFKRAWERALPVLRSKVNKVTFESYIRAIRPLAFEQQEATLGVPSPFAREWLEKRYSALIADTLESIVGCPVSLRFHILAAEERAPLATAAELIEEPAPAVAVVSAPSRRGGRNHATHDFGLPLNERYTFENFIVGKSNRLAQAAAAAVGDSPGAVYNPLFVYGAPGLGKTHLLHAIGNSVRAQKPDARVAFIDGENFTYHYVTALRERKTEEFRRYYRGIDVWLVDDIQFIAGREQTKEEFFHTFNALYQTCRQIVIASDRSPRELRTMDERLRSRFECGLIADIGAPDLETRMAILDRRARAEEWDVSQEVIYYVASAIRSNIRALEGALTKLVACSSVMRCPITVDLAGDVLGDYLIEKPLPGGQRKGVTAEIVLAAVAEQFGTSVDVITGQRRDKAVVTARQVAMFLCREVTGGGLAQIGAAIGGRDHTTVQRGIAKIERLLEHDDSVKAAVRDARERLER